MFKKLLLLFVIMCAGTFCYAINDVHQDNAVRLKCVGDSIKKTKNNQIAGDVYSFVIKDNHIYDTNGQMLKKAEITDGLIKGTYKVKNDFTWENVRFTIDRYSGAFSYIRTITTIDGSSKHKNTGTCSVIKNEKMF